MAFGRISFPIQGSQPKLLVLAGNFGSTTDVEGRGYSVVSGATGQYTVTLPGTGLLDVLAVCHDFESTDLAATCSLEARDDSARSVTFQVDDTGARALAAGERIHFIVIARNTGMAD